MSTGFIVIVLLLFGVRGSIHAIGKSLRIIGFELIGVENITLLKLLDREASISYNTIIALFVDKCYSSPESFLEL